MSMRVLWITNLFFPEFYENYNLKSPVMGGWMKALADSIIKSNPEVELAVASPWSNSKSVEELKIDNYTFYTLPVKGNNTKIETTSIEYWKEIKKLFNPDIIHIHGSEFTHGYGWIQANGNKNVVVSIQGLVSVIARYAEAGIRFSRRKDFTLHDMIFRSYPDRLSKNLNKAGISERILLQSVNNIIGRTSWDKAQTWAINPEARYYFCNENLRDAFYSEIKWNKDRCIKHRIFLSQAAKPIKGLHKLIQALPYILREYPDTEVFVAGSDFTKRDTILNKLKYTGFAKYTNRLMQENKVTNKIHFLGFLDATQMADQYRLANVFVCPSSIENSPNSLGEAQLMGSPVVASYVGGIPDMVDNRKTGFVYPFEEHEMLAESICEIFANEDLANDLSLNGVLAASKRHDREVNARKMIKIYNDIIDNHK